MAVDADAKRLLSDEEIAAALEDLPGWERQGDKLAATFNFSDFSEAFGFMSRVALISERLFHVSLASFTTPNGPTSGPPSKSPSPTTPLAA